MYKYCFASRYIHGRHRYFARLDSVRSFSRESEKVDVNDSTRARDSPTNLELVRCYVNYEMGPIPRGTRRNSRSLPSSSSSFLSILFFFLLIRTSLMRTRAMNRERFTSLLPACTPKRASTECIEICETEGSCLLKYSPRTLHCCYFERNNF